WFFRPFRLSLTFKSFLRLQKYYFLLYPFYVIMSILPAAAGGGPPAAAGGLYGPAGRSGRPGRRCVAETSFSFFLFYNQLLNFCKLSFVDLICRRRRV